MSGDQSDQTKNYYIILCKQQYSAQIHNWMPTRRFVKAPTVVRTARRKQAVQTRRRSARSSTLRTKRGLNKTERKQVSDIVNSKAESKYFKSDNGLQGQALKVQSDDASNQEIMVRGFTVGPGGVAIGNETYGYEGTGLAQRAITPMFMARTFDANDLNDEYQNQIPDGKYVMPAMSRCTWRLHRDKVATSDSLLEKSAAPYVIRFIRVKPRQSKFSDVDIVPRLDLFMNNYGHAYGIESPTNAYQKNFGLFEMQTSKINSRKYIVLQDSMFTMNAPLTSTLIDADFLSTMQSTSSQKLITTNHKQPNKLYYAGGYNTADNREPLAGQSNEMIFIHVGVLGTNTKSVPLSMRIDVKPVSTFKDI